ncbi:MAG: hypothetical protein IJW06_01375 [Clostridia bacterium]|nr:hypothetical protein [Clostridia bacterium]
MTDIERNENESFASQNDAENKNTDKQEKMFTQSQLEEIISERLSRERRVNESLLSVKTLLKSAADKGLIKGSSYAEMARELVGKLKNPSAENTAEEASDAKEEVPEEMCESTDEESDAKEISENGKQDFADADAKEKSDARYVSGNTDDSAENKEKDTQDGFVSMLCDIKSRYPKGEVEKLLSGDLFERFAKGKSGNIREIVDDFFSFISSFGERDDQNVKNDGYSSFASTAFSSQSGTVGGAANLTKQQMEIAKSAGMSYREYANLLESVPKRAGRTN